jgi:hypothetical protein
MLILLRLVSILMMNQTPIINHDRPLQIIKASEASGAITHRWHLNLTMETGVSEISWWEVHRRCKVNSTIGPMRTPIKLHLTTFHSLDLVIKCRIKAKGSYSKNLMNTLLIIKGQNLTITKSSIVRHRWKDPRLLRLVYFKVISDYKEMSWSRSTMKMMNRKFP